MLTVIETVLFCLSPFACCAALVAAIAGLARMAR
jgi:hypothetical protein